ncbi:polysaccharide deacetylase family protein [Povalibacter sp.]|uniref:polysaccharide deacetylase family protein n=1 Tax=Povalibacter sp. TaxID=1962978 RepID=UPI002F40087E
MNGAASSPRVFLTFDDGPDPEWTPRILDLLLRADVRASFFVIGVHAQHEPALVRRMAAEGHTVGNHTFSHRHPWLLSNQDAAAQVHEGCNAITAVLGQMPMFYRAPHGRHRQCMIDAAVACGEIPVPWQLSAVDWGPLGTAARIAARLRRIRPDDIVLMHDGRNRHNRPDELLRVLPGFLDELADRGLRPVALDGY